MLVFPEGQKGTRKLFWQRYKLRRFGRGGFVKTAIRAGVPIVPIAVMGAEEAMPIFAHVPLLQRLTGLIYFPINHAFPHFGLLAGGMYMPAKFRIRFLEPVRFERHGPDAADDVAFVQQVADDIRAAHPGRAERNAAGSASPSGSASRIPCGRAGFRRPDRIGSAPLRRTRRVLTRRSTCACPRDRRVALLALLAVLLASPVAGCGSDDEARSQERPPVPINVSVQIGQDEGDRVARRVRRRAR